MLNTLHLQNGGSTDTEDCDCIVHQTFYGRLSSTVTCDSCKNTTTAFESYMDLSLDIRNLPKKKKSENASADDSQIGVQSCLDRFTGREKLGEYTCQNCDGGQNATKQLSIKQLPPVLPIHLKVPLPCTSHCRLILISNSALRAQQSHVLQNRDKNQLSHVPRSIPIHNTIPRDAEQALQSLLSTEH